MLKYNLIVSLFILALNACSQNEEDTLLHSKTESQFDYSVWTELADGVDYIEMKAPDSSILGDSKLSVLRIEPEKLEFLMYNATQNDKKKLSAPEWADSLDIQIVLNAGMYELSNGLIHRGYLKNGEHYNNAVFNPNYNSMLAFQSVDSTKSDFEILDLQCSNWKSVCNDYMCYAQGMRMIDCNGEALGWNKRYQSCSMLVAAKDEQGRIHFIFSRSPYTHNQMISFITKMPGNLSNAIYLEGGPETSFYVHIGEHKIEKMGSYVSGTYPKDDNVEFWQLPNLIGIRVKDKKLSKQDQ